MTRDQAGSYTFMGHMYHRAGGDWWIIWPALGWGVGVAIQAIVVLVGGPGKLDAWEDRKAEELATREGADSGVTAAAVTTPSGPSTTRR